MKLYINYSYLVLTIVLLINNSNGAWCQSSYNDYAEFFRNVDFNNRVVPAIPPKNQKINVIIDADAKNEIDDQWALTLALLSPERFNIIGIIGTTFLWGGPQSIQMSVNEIDTILKLTGRTEIPVYAGSMPLQYPYEPTKSEGVDFIIQEAMKANKDEPLWIIGLGAATNIASAYLLQPEISENIRVFWHLRTQWLDNCYNFNVFGDPHASRLLFHSPLSFVLFDTGTYLTCPMEESEKEIKPHGDIGSYLHNIRIGNSWYESDTKGFFDLGDIAVMLDPSVGYFEEVSCPEVDHDLSYQFKDTKGRILRCYHVERDKTFQLLYQKLHRNAPN